MMKLVKTVHDLFEDVRLARKHILEILPTISELGDDLEKEENPEIRQRYELLVDSMNRQIEVMEEALEDLEWRGWRYNY